MDFSLKILGIITHLEQKKNQNKHRKCWILFVVGGGEVRSVSVKNSPHISVNCKWWWQFKGAKEALLTHVLQPKFYTYIAEKILLSYSD